MTPQAWLENATAGNRPLPESFAIGRSAECQLVLRDAKVSRKHCLIQRQGTTSEYWLSDLQSANGTRLNGRRIAQTARLHDGDVVELAGYEFRFRQPGSGSAPGQSATVTRTIQEIRNRRCWLLVGDLVGSTSKLGNLAAQDAATLTGRWLENCRRLVEGNGGFVNKYLGDGFLAYWTDEPEVEKQVWSALTGLQALQKAGPPAFRMVLHYGPTVFGGAPSLGEESLAGPEVNFTFRMEKLASMLGFAALLSEPAAQKLPAARAAALERTHPLQGFQGEHKFFTF